MSLSMDVVMVVPARPLADLLSEILHRWEGIGYISRDPVHTWSEKDGPSEVDLTGDWVDRVNALEGLSFSAHRVGPPIDAHLSKLDPATLRASFNMSDGLFEKLYRAKTIPENWVSPILQAALALDARYGVGGLEIEIEPEREEDVESEIRSGHWLSFVRFDAPRAAEHRAMPGYVVTERPEGYWWFESENYHGFFSP
ncbi:MAG TPA: hypothetical protein VF950_13520 [Planctomycetota bacterium]